jgi:hypothetical protein
VEEIIMWENDYVKGENFCSIRNLMCEREKKLKFEVKEILMEIDSEH